MKRISLRRTPKRLLAVVGGLAVIAAGLAIVPAILASNCQVLDSTRGVCYAHIQAAINDANAGDTILVGNGTYNENIRITTPGITLESRHGSAHAIIVGAPAASGSPYDAVVDIAADNVTLGGSDAGFTIENASSAGFGALTQLFGVNIGANPNPASNATVQDNIITGLDPAASQPSSSVFRVVGIAVTEGTNTTLTQNSIRDMSLTTAAGKSNVFEYGILFYGPNSGATVTHNRVNNLSESGGACLGTGVLGIALNDHLSNGVASDNTVSDFTTDCEATGIGGSAITGPLAITFNSIGHIASSTSENSGVGLESSAVVTVNNNLMEYDGSGIAVLVAPGAGSNFERNNFFRNPYGVFNDTNATVDATNNWWGCAAGPGQPKCDNPLNVGAGSINYTPWLTNRAVDQPRG